MRIQHFEALRPVCPVCRTGNGDECALEIARTFDEQEGHIIEGVLLCTRQTCLREYPIIDGVPLIISGIRTYLADNAFQVCARTDLSEDTEGILGDCLGPGSEFDTQRQHLSSYVWDHYAEFDPREPQGDPRPGSVIRVLQQGLNLARENRTGPIIDVGCSVGRTSFALAQKSDELVLGIDLNYSMLKTAAMTLRTGIVRYPRRRVGLVYDRREFPVNFARTENVDFWACDATALPFAAETFATAVSLNALDCVHSPSDLIGSLASTLKPGAQVIITCPYDWSNAATPVEAWLGGHSQRGPHRGESASVLRALLSPGEHPQAIPNLRIVAEANDLDWQVRMHERSVVAYRVHLVVAEMIEA